MNEMACSGLYTSSQRDFASFSDDISSEILVKNLEAVLRQKDEEIIRINRHCEYIMELYYDMEERLARRSEELLSLKVHLALCTCDKPARTSTPKYLYEKITNQKATKQITTDINPCYKDDSVSAKPEYDIHDFINHDVLKTDDIINNGATSEDLSDDDTLRNTVSPHSGRYNSVSSPDVKQLDTLHCMHEYTFDCNGLIDDTPLFPELHKSMSLDRSLSMTLSDLSTSSQADILYVDPEYQKRGIIGDGKDSYEATTTDSRSTQRDDKTQINSEEESKSEIDTHSITGILLSARKHRHVKTLKHTSSHRPANSIPNTKKEEIDLELNELDFGEHAHLVSARRLRPKAVGYTFDILPSKRSMPQVLCRSSRNKPTKIPKPTYSNRTEPTFARSVSNYSMKYSDSEAKTNTLFIISPGMKKASSYHNVCQTKTLTPETKEGNERMKTQFAEHASARYSREERSNAKHTYRPGTSPVIVQLERQSIDINSAPINNQYSSTSYNVRDKDPACKYSSTYTKEEIEDERISIQSKTTHDREEKAKSSNIDKIVPTDTEHNESNHHLPVVVPSVYEDQENSEGVDDYTSDDDISLREEITNITQEAAINRKSPLAFFHPEIPTPIYSPTSQQTIDTLSRSIALQKKKKERKKHASFEHAELIKPTVPDVAEMYNDSRKPLTPTRRSKITKTQNHDSEVKFAKESEISSAEETIDKKYRLESYSENVKKPEHENSAEMYEKEKRHKPSVDGSDKACSVMNSSYAEKDAKTDQQEIEIETRENRILTDSRMVSPLNEVLPDLTSSSQINKNFEGNKPEEISNSNEWPHVPVAKRPLSARSRRRVHVDNGNKARPQSASLPYLTSQIILKAQSIEDDNTDLNLMQDSIEMENTM